MGFVQLSTLYLKGEWSILKRLLGHREWGISKALHSKQSYTGLIASHPWVLDKLMNQDKTIHFSLERERKAQFLIRKCSLYCELCERIS